ncbi:MAG: HDIG domain-containing metalloprotein [Bacteroidota bacterium]
MNRFFSLLYQHKRRDPRYLARLGIILGYLLLITLILPKSPKRAYTFSPGQEWKAAPLEAPFDFSIQKTEAQQEEEIEQATRQVLRIYRQDSIEADEVKDAIGQRFLEIGKLLQVYQLESVKPDTQQLYQYRNDFRKATRLNPAFFPFDTTSVSPRWLSRLSNSAKKLVDSVYAVGYLNAQRGSFQHDYISLLTSPSETQQLALDKLMFPPDVYQLVRRNLRRRSQVEQSLANNVLNSVLVPSYVFDKARTDRTIAWVKNRVLPVEGLVKAGEVIITRGEIITDQKSRIIQSLISEQEERFGDENIWSIFLSQFLVVFLITAKLLIYLGVNRPRIYFDNRRLSLILITSFVSVLAMILALQLEEQLGQDLPVSLIYLAPTCIVSILVTNFYDPRTSFLCNLLIAMYGGVLVQRGLEFAFVQIIVGTVAVYSLRRLRERQVFFFTLGYIWVAYVVSHTAFSVFSKGSAFDVEPATLLVFLFNIALCFLAYPLIYGFEKLFGLTSDLTYLELLDTNHPLLQELARKAPGSFMHSLQVASIAEATVNVVGGNALQIHVGAMYHDIGKMVNPSYFIENSSPEESPHHCITCEESADLIIGHVIEGVHLAQKNNLPKEIIDFIKTHHGNTRVEYFYRKHLKEAGCEEPEHEDRFRYPGPLPFTKEQAVLMIADSIEAASRSLKEPNPENLKKLVNNIIDHKISDNQLENSSLTFRDISIIRKVIYQQLLSIYHGRIEYPEEETQASTPVASS